MTADDDLARYQAAYFALCAHLREAHDTTPCGNANQVEAAHRAAHAREHTPWHADAYRLPARPKARP